jgi:sulfite reductase alpha subunit-like flavoprotein
MNLYEIDMAYKHLQDLIEQNEGEIPEDLEVQFDSIVTDRNEKIKNIVRFIRNLGSDSDQIYNEMERLKVIAELKNKKAARLKDYLSVIVGEGNKFELPEAKISWRKSEATFIKDENAIPEKFITIVTEKKIDKVAIKNAIKSGEEVSGAEIITRNNMQIK